VPASKINVAHLLRFLYFHGGSERLRLFLDETFCDEFFITLPVYLASIYDDLGFIYPLDIEKFKPYEDENRFVSEDTKTDFSKLNEFIDSLKIDVEPQEEKENDKIDALIVSTAKDLGKYQISSAKRSTIPDVIPETPEKESPAGSSMDCDEEGVVVVLQTPVKMLKRNSAISTTRLSERINFELNRKSAISNRNRKRTLDNPATPSLPDPKKQKLSSFVKRK